MRKRCRQLAGMLACVLAVAGISVLPAQAGASNIVIDNQSFAEKLDTSLWNDVDGDVLIENGNLVFTKDSTQGTALITKATAKISKYISELVSAEATMNLSGIPQGETFALALGLSDIEAELEDDGNIEIRFTNNGGLKCSVVLIDDTEETVLAQPSGVSSTAKVSANITADSVLKVTVNGKQICNTKLSVSGEGKVGFLQSGSCKVTVSDVRIVTHEYDRPENCNVQEDFERGDINLNVLTGKMINSSSGYDHSRMIIKEINGNNAWCFDYSGHAYFGTMYQYSNFELTFDVVYLQRAAVRNEEGDLVIPQNGNFAISYGDEAADYGSGVYGYLTSTDMLVFGTGSSIDSLNTKESVKVKDVWEAFYDADCNRNFTVRLSMIDSVATVYMKWQDETNFTEVMKYQISERTPTGYIHIWTTSNPANFAIDNLSIINKDEDPNLVEPEYASSILEVPEDFKYEPLTYNYQDTTEATQTGNVSAYLLIPVVVGICAVSFGVALLLTKKSKKKAGGDTNEK